MSTLLRVDPERPDRSAIARAAAVLRAGGLVAFPTETVYGLGGNALDEDAVRSIFRAKGRPAFNPLIAHVASLDAAKGLTTTWSPTAESLARTFWPGPLTLVLPKSVIVPDLVTAGLPSVAVRVPGHPIALELLRQAGIPVAAPSANRYTALSPTTAGHVLRGLGDRVQLILDGGPTEVGIESTVVDLTGDRPVLLRPGTLSREELEAVTGPIRLAGEVAGTAPRPSPGMVERHYAPRAELRVVSDRRALVEAAEVLAGSDMRTGVIARHPLNLPDAEVHLLPDDPQSFARALYATLHALDDSGCEVILVEEVPEGSAWAGVRDRLRRAAHP